VGADVDFADADERKDEDERGGGVLGEEGV